MASLSSFAGCACHPLDISNALDSPFDLKSTMQNLRYDIQVPGREYSDPKPWPPRPPTPHPPRPVDPRTGALRSHADDLSLALHPYLTLSKFQVVQRWRAAVPPFMRDVESNC
ncbi:hypothetical protein LIPSTDRAFT_61511 [Lipomyces starkeyi NRRL Y-11557]|uniref:Uncharacterized protein n=1 Tax=Lipomyces starkeyi NRRL Y-11557 TaxID=675824 RepID=A0A1E3QFT2_LIPST|nr:hypothetical protein LIPSTDRAFT_61511 [Lipomyces starkeyi NRRL Y-11557]